jgi:hypothetical protein
MVLECKSAEMGVGATMAPHSQLWKGQLGCLGEAGEAQQADRQQGQLGGRIGGDDLLQRQGQPLGAEDDEGEDKGHAAQHVHPQGAGRVLDRDLGTVMLDEHERTQGGHFPEEVEPQEVVGEDQPVHGAQEQDHEKEEPALSGFFELQVMLVLAHVGQAVQTDERADNGDDHAHDHGELIDVQGRAHVLARIHEQLQKGQGHDLQQGQDGDELVLEPVGDAQDDEQEREIKDRDQTVGVDPEKAPGCKGKRPRLHQQERCEGNDHAGADHQRGPQGWNIDQTQRCRNERQDDANP